MTFVWAPALTRRRKRGSGVTKAVAEGPQVFEWRARKKNGELFWVEVALKSATINGQRRILAVVRDITERVVAEEALRATHQRLLDTIESLPDATFILDHDKHVIAWTGVGKLHLPASRRKPCLAKVIMLMPFRFMDNAAPC